MSECKISTGSTDCISRQAVIDLMMQKWGENFSGDDAMQESIDAIRVLPSVTPQEPVKKLEEQIKQLQNRCHALTHGQICVFCPYECEHKAESEDKE